ncbi:MAG: DUF502 domain-containing protein [Chlamydiales bacterium]|nr:DUF502 domain-containing protein [Chlamydiales bacterium]
MRKSLFVGFVTLLPVLVTYIVLAFAIHLVTLPFQYSVRLVLENAGLFREGIGVFTQDQVIAFLSNVLIIVFLVCLIFMVGFVAARGFHSLGLYIEKVIHKIPVIGNVYGPTKELITMLFHPQSEAPRQAVLVPYPSKDQQTVGIVTCEFRAKLYDHQIEPEEYVSVFVPSVPNATGGYLCTYLKNEVTIFDMPADEALKYVMSFANKSTQS